MTGNDVPGRLKQALPREPHPASNAHQSRENRPSKSTLIFGGGYVGDQVAALCAERGDHVIVTTRNQRKAERFVDLGYQPVLANWNQESGLKELDRLDLNEIDRILVSVSYDARGDQSRRESQVIGLSRLLRRLPDHTNLVYISTTGVYHQADGRWVDETSPTHPRREGGRIHLEAEQQIRRRGSTNPWTILRLAGIYGPGRIPLVRNVIEGRTISTAPDGYLNLIHVQDAAAATLAAWDKMEQELAAESRSAGCIRSCKRLYLVADDQPVIRRRFYEEIARLCAAPPPRFDSAIGNGVLSPRSSSHKRIWNRRMKNQLLSRLLYPTYREGLAQILGSPDSIARPGVPPVPPNS